MKILIKYLFFLLIILISSCSGGKDNKTVTTLDGDKIESQMMEAYKEGLKEFENRDFLLAAKKFNEAELLFPQSDWAPKASLMAAYSFYIDGFYNDSIFQIENFIKKGF